MFNHPRAEIGNRVCSRVAIMARNSIIIRGAIGEWPRLLIFLIKVFAFRSDD